MSRFDGAAYDKLFPRVEDIPKPETVVPTFTPTTDKIEHPEVVEKETSIPDADHIEVDPDLVQREVVIDGDGEHSKSDPE